MQQDFVILRCHQRSGWYHVIFWCDRAVSDPMLLGTIIKHIRYLPEIIVDSGDILETKKMGYFHI